MKHFLLLGFLLLNSPNVLSDTSASLKASEGQLQFVQSIGQVAPSLNIEAYERELKYLKMGLTLEEKVRSEVNIIAEAIRLKVIQSYEAEFARTGSAYEAEAIVKAAIQRDLELADEEMRDDLLKIAEHSLDSLTSGLRSTELNLTKLEEVMKDNIQKREAYLLSQVQGDQKRITRASDSSSDVEFQNFNSRQDLVRALVKEEQGSRWFKTASTTLRVGEGRENGGSISLQVKIEFLGVTVEAGPRINFRREYNTSVNILADGLAPVMNSNGTFNFFEKDAHNRTTNKRRFIGFFCDASLSFRTEYEGRGGFKVIGVGGDASLKKDYSNQVQLNSRRLHVPEVVGGKKVDLNFLSRICLSDFLNAQINSQVKVKDSLNIMMKNVISGLRFTHPDTQCVRDSHCNKWFRTEVVGILRNKATARCIQSSGAQFVCALRGTQGQACTIIENGKRTSSGMGEYICDKGLRCVKTRNEGWFQGGRLYQPSAGVCR
jgi:hypothetical protein